MFMVSLITYGSSLAIVIRGDSGMDEDFYVMMTILNGGHILFPFGLARLLIYCWEKALIT